MPGARLHSFHFYHLFLLLLVDFLLPCYCHGSLQSTDPEQTILLKLKEHWSNPPLLSHWTSSSHHCSWPEITCVGGSVTQLYVSNKTINYRIPPFVCNMKNLGTIDLSYNFIPGAFPTVLYSCSNLEILDLSFNYFVGTIPDDINRLSPRLSYLSLMSNNLTGDIPSAIGLLPELKTLLLMGNLFNGSFPPEIGDLSNLEDLELGQNGFDPSNIPSSFGQLKKLRRLVMTEMNLIGEIPDGIGNLTALELIDLSSNRLSGNIPNRLFLCKNLTTVFLYKNRLSGPIPQSLEALKLDVIDLSQNNLTGRIPEGFGKLRKLTGLALFSNQLSGGIPPSISRLPALIVLRVFQNNLSGELPQDFGRYSKLEEFQVSSNKFVGKLPEHLCDGGALAGVIAFDNNLTGEFPKSLGSCSSMTTVRVDGNRFHGQIPDGLWTSKNLTTLILSNNSFSGQLPRKVGFSLSLVEISDNQFSGGIPPEISSWTNLIKFKASNNHLTGAIPVELTALPLVSTILLDGNQLSGHLPPNIISWHSLNELNLSRNGLSGKIPSPIGRLPSLTFLDLSENDLSGEIPMEVGLLKLTDLNLSSNHLSGKIPSELENAAFNRSFLNNPDLCSSNPILLGLPRCHPEHKYSGKLSRQAVAAVISISAVLSILALSFSINVIRILRKGNHVMDSSSWKLTSFQKLDFTESNILPNLTENRVIGSGGSGIVYLVPINRSGGFVAVKRIWAKNKSDQMAEKEFLAEVEILSKIRHANIVKLLCCMSREDSKILVYEYMENRSLDTWLHGRKRSSSALSGSVGRAVLDWPTRMQIAVGAAQGLCYMHHHCSPPIIHRDLKSSNILLDSDFKAKVADFGLSRMLAKQGEPDTMTAVIGSYGYIAPEYANTRRVNEKIDVYAFGVILLEMVTGKEANYGDEHSSLAQWAWRHIQGAKSDTDAFDEDIKEDCHVDEMSAVFKLGIICTGTLPSTRPTMKQVLQILLQFRDPLLFGEKNIEGGEQEGAAPTVNITRKGRHDNGNFATTV